MKERSEERS